LEAQRWRQAHLLGDLPRRGIVRADRSGTNRVRGPIEGQGAVRNVPPKRTSLWKGCFKILCKSRNAIGRISVVQPRHLCPV
jgi:hypothetical protein